MAQTNMSQQAQQDTLDYLELHPYRVTAHELAMALNISLVAASIRLARMHQRGLLSRRRLDLRGSIHEYEYSLVEDEERRAA
jgi:predicted transcriptional regulator